MKNSQALLSAYYQEWAFVYGRKFLLTILALGSVLVTHMIGAHIGKLIFPTLPLIQLVVQVFFVMMGWAAIDWVLANALASASNVDEEEKKGEKNSKRPVWVFAIVALLSTLALSLVSNFFISNQLAGETHLNDFNQMVVKSMAQDSSLKSKAFSILEDAPKVQNKLVTDALAQRGRLVAKAVNNGSVSWQRDYKRDKNNRTKGFLWKCRRCPENYKAYRREILAAEKEGNQLVEIARNHQSSIHTSLSPTLSYQLGSDSLLHAVKTNTDKLEAERKDRQNQLNLILLSMTLGCGILSLILTYVLREHRKRYGQQVIENNVRLFMLIFDVFSRLGNGLMDIGYTLIVQPFNYFHKKGWLKRYRLSANRVTDKPETVTDVSTDSNTTVKRLCLNCSTDISHKRKGAKYCGDSCRMAYHNFVPHKRNGIEI